MTDDGKKVHLLTPEEMEFSRELAQKLKEYQKKPRQLISRIIRYMGMEKAQEYYERTMRIQHNGGLFMEEMKRRRTTGGVFFKLVKDEIDDELNQKVFLYGAQTARKRELARSRNRGAPMFVWEKRKEQLQEALEKREELEEVRVQILGIPKNIETFHDNVVLVMEHQEDISNWTIPNGMPELPDEPTIYTIYMGSLQWSKVKNKMENPQTILAIEGIGAYDPEIPGIAVYATNVTTKQRKMKNVQKTEEQKTEKKQKDKEKDKGKTKAKAKAEPAPKKKPAKKAKPAKEKEKAPAAPPPPVIKTERLEVVIPDNAPADVKQKLKELYNAADQFQKKIEAIQSKPASEQFGLSMTDKLLKNVQTQIKKLVDQYS